MNDPVLHHLLQLSLRDSESGMNLIESEHEVSSSHLHRIEIVGDSSDGSDLCKNGRTKDASRVSVRFV